MFSVHLVHLLDFSDLLQLFVDLGLVAREQATEYMLEHTARTKESIEREVNRCIQEEDPDHDEADVDADADDDGDDEEDGEKVHSLPDDEDEEEEDADEDVLSLMRMATMRRMTMVRFKREVNRCIFSHSWRRFWKKKDLLVNQINWTATLFSLVLGKTSSIPQFSDTSPGRAKLWDTRCFHSKYFVNGCQFLRGIFDQIHYRYEIHQDLILFHLSKGGAA